MSDYGCEQQHRFGHGASGTRDPVAGDQQPEPAAATGRRELVRETSALITNKQTNKHSINNNNYNTDKALTELCETDNALDFVRFEGLQFLQV